MIHWLKFRSIIIILIIVIYTNLVTDLYFQSDRYDILTETREGILRAHQHNQTHGGAYKKLCSQAQDVAMQMVQDDQIPAYQMTTALRVRVDHNTTIKF